MVMRKEEKWSMYLPMIKNLLERDISIPNPRLVRILNKKKRRSINENFFINGFCNAGNTGKGWDILKIAGLVFGEADSFRS